MPKGESWSRLENEATVADYMQMLLQELAGQHYNKAEHRRQLMLKLDERTPRAVELKHQNISAILRDMKCIWIPGYKPMGNYQANQPALTLDYAAREARNASLGLSGEELVLAF